MGLFNEKKQDFIGVDIGTSSIKIVQLANEKGRARLVTYGMIDISSDITRNKTPETVKMVVSAIKKLKEKSRVSTKLCSAALPTFSVFSSVISLPKMDKTDMDSAVKWEAKKFIPFPIEEMIINWHLLDNNNDNKNNVLTNSSISQNEKDFIKTELKFDRILLTAAPKNLVSMYLEIFKQAELNLYALEIESFAMARSLIDSDAMTAMIVDIGSVTTDVCVVQNGLPILNRSIEIGGNMMTTSIAKSLNISMERAEQFKQDFGLVSQSISDSSIPKTIEETLSPMINEIKYVFDLYRRQGKGSVDKVVLTGGSAYLPNLVDYLKNVLNTQVYIGDAWHKIMYPVDLKPVLDEIGPRFAVAIGLAMKNIV